MAKVFGSSVLVDSASLPTNRFLVKSTPSEAKIAFSRDGGRSVAIIASHRRDAFSSSISVSSTSGLPSGGPGAKPTRVPHAGTIYDGSDAAADSIGPITIYTAEEGKPVQFQDLWDQKNGVAVVAFLRHFGCMFCWEFAGQLRDAKPTLDAAGVKLITIGVGKPDKAQLMAQKVNFPIECLYCDDDRKAYRALELPGDVGTFLFPKKSPLPKLSASLDSIRSVLSNGYQMSAPDDKTGVMQQGGLYVFKGQEVLFARKEEHVGDHPDLKEVLDVCCTIPEYA